MDGTEVVDGLEGEFLDGDVGVVVEEEDFEAWFCLVEDGDGAEVESSLVRWEPGVGSWELVGEPDSSSPDAWF